MMDYPKVNQEMCIGCGACLDTCPMNAISLENDKASIKQEQCRNCLICKQFCPLQAITIN